MKYLIMLSFSFFLGSTLGFKGLPYLLAGRIKKGAQPSAASRPFFEVGLRKQDGLVLSEGIAKGLDQNFGLERACAQVKDAGQIFSGAKADQNFEVNDNWLAQKMPVEPIEEESKPEVVRKTNIDVQLKRDDPESVFADMDELNLKMAKLQMEIKMAQLELQKLDLQVQQAKMRKELEIVGPVAGEGGMVSRVLMEGPLAVLGIMSFGAEKTVSIKIAGKIQELREGDALESDDGVSRRVIEIDPAADSVLIAENGENIRHFVAGTNKNN
jgi:hypothetical protein